MKKVTQKGFTIVEGLLLIVLFALVASVGYYVYQQRSQEKIIGNFEECAAAGNPIAESYPEQCSANGQTFVRDIANDSAKEETIGKVTFKHADFFDEELRKEIMQKVTDPILYYEVTQLKDPNFKGLEVDLTLEQDNKTRSGKFGYTVSWVGEGEAFDVNFTTIGSDGEIEYWTPQLCDDGGCNEYPDDFKKKFPANFEAYKKKYDNDPYYIR